jgi:hypothetical protein
VPTFKERFPKVEGPDSPWREHHIDDDSIRLVLKCEKMPDNDRADFRFEATCKKGIVHVEIVRTKIVVNEAGDLIDEGLLGGYDRARAAEKNGTGTEVRARWKEETMLDAKELYPMMQAHFEKAGHKITGIEGEYMWDNRQDYKDALQRGLPAKEAIREARTFKKFWEPWLENHGYDIEVTELRESGLMVRWQLKLVPKASSGKP